MNGQEETWRAFHVFYFDEEHVDALILEADRLISSLSPVGRSWFFIRYNVGGMHLRFRLRDSSGCFDETLLRLREKVWRPEGAPAAWADVPKGGVPDERGHFHHPGSVVEIPYVPEIERYGGPHAIAENERLFEHSTSIAVRIIAATSGDPPKRAKLATDLMLAAAALAVEDDRSFAAFFDSYARFWALRYFKSGAIPDQPAAPGRPAVAERLRQLRDYASSREAPRIPSHYWLRALGEAKGRFAALASSGKLVAPRDGGIVADDSAFADAFSDMLVSQMHMMNNRLGFGPYVEMMWSRALARSLAE